MVNLPVATRVLADGGEGPPRGACLTTPDGLKTIICYPPCGDLTRHHISAWLA